MRSRSGMETDPILETALRRHIVEALDAADRIGDVLVAVHLCNALEVLDRGAQSSDVNGGDES